jgi:plastocyanin
MLGAVSVAAGDRSKPTTHTVTIEGLKFEPEALMVADGDTVVWVNNDLVAHTATSSDAGVFDSKLIAPDKSWKLTCRQERRLRLHMHVPPHDEGDVAGPVVP